MSCQVHEFGKMEGGISREKGGISRQKGGISRERGTGLPALAHVFMFLEMSKRQAMLLEPCSLGLLTVGGLRRKGGKAKPAGVLPEYSLYTTHCWRIW